MLKNFRIVSIEDPCEGSQSRRITLEFKCDFNTITYVVMMGDTIDPVNLVKGAQTIILGQLKDLVEEMEKQGLDRNDRSWITM